MHIRRLALHVSRGWDSNTFAWNRNKRLELGNGRARDIPVKGAFEKDPFSREVLEQSSKLENQGMRRNRSPRNLFYGVWNEKSCEVHATPLGHHLVSEKWYFGTSAMTFAFGAIICARFDSSGAYVQSIKSLLWISRRSTSVLELLKVGLLRRDGRRISWLRSGSVLRHLAMWSMQSRLVPPVVGRPCQSFLRGY